MNLEFANRAAEILDRGVETSTPIGAYCNSAKYLVAEAAFKACEKSSC